MEVGAFDLEFWWELALLIDVMLLGHWQEMKALGQASGALEALAALLPDEAEIVEVEGTRTVQAHELEPGMLVLVRSGGRVPADGTIEEGTTEFDESMITGESRPVPRASATRWSLERSRPTAPCGSASLRLARTRRSRASAASCWKRRRRSRGPRLSPTEQRPRSSTSRWLRRGDVRGLGCLGDMDQAVERSVTVLVISCPHALGLAIPLVIAISTSVAARAGILIKDRLALERMRTIDTVLFDKTGTLTRGTPIVTDVGTVTATPTKSFASRRPSSPTASTPWLGRSCRPRAATLLFLGRQGSDR